MVAGVTVMLLVVAPLSQTKDVPPVAISIVDWPAQMVFVPETEMEGSASTFTTFVAVA